METATPNRSQAGKQIATLRLPLSGALLLGALLLVLAFLATPPVVLCAPEAIDTLVLVNGDPISVGDMDEMIMGAHKSFDMEAEGSGIVDRLLNKRINDILIIQDALAAGMDEEPELAC